MELEEIEQLIRSGQSRQAKARLMEGVRRREIQGMERPALKWAAGLCRRSGWPEGGLTLLKGLVRPAVRARGEALAEEKIEYAACLNQIGLAQEARGLLGGVEKAHPAKFLPEALTYISEWDYASAVPLLREGLQSAELPPYTHLILGVNLAAALVMIGELREALVRLGELREACERQQYLLLLGNVLEITAQAQIKLGHLGDAETNIQAAFQLLKEHASVERIYLLKLKAVLEMHRHGLDRERQRQMSVVLTEAQAVKHWETWRDCHLELSAFAKGRRLKDHLYFGTPYVSFRKRLELNYAPPTRGYVWRLGPAGPGVLLNTVTGVKSGDARALKPGQVLQRVLLCLTSDFYRPQSVPMIFASLFPDRYYDAVTSPTVVHQTLKRFRHWLDRANLPLRVREESGTYRLVADRAVRIQIPLQKMNRSAWELSALADVGPQFSRAEFCAHFGISAKSANTRIKELLVQGHLTKIGAGPRVRYRLAARGR